MTNTFDPDKFNLTKKDILLIMDAIGKRWGKSKIQKLKNAHYIIGLEAIKIGIMAGNDEVLTQIWKDIIMGFNILIEENDRARMLGEFPDMKDLVKIARDKIESGEAFDSNRE